MTEYAVKRGRVESVREVKEKSLPDYVSVTIEMEDGEKTKINLRNFGWLCNYLTKNGVDIASSKSDVRENIYGDELVVVVSDDSIECFAEPRSKRAEYFVGSHQKGSEQSSTTP